MRSAIVEGYGLMIPYTVSIDGCINQSISYYLMIGDNLKLFLF